MAFLFSGTAIEQSQVKPRSKSRLLQAGPPHSAPNASSVSGHQVTAPPTHAGTVHTRLIPLTDWNQHHAWPPIGGLRHLVFFSNSNGFDKVIRRVGRRVLIDEAAFFAWVDGQGARHGQV